MELALLAAGCMVFQDVISVIMVQAEAANRGWLAGWMDTVGWYFGIATTSISVGAINGHNATERYLVLAFVGAANLIGTKVGQVTGKRLVRTQPDLTTRVAELEARIAELEAR